MVSEWDGSWKEEDFANAYRNWLADYMEAEGYSILFDVLHDTEFEWDHVRFPRDSDREADGRYLRLRFSDESGMDIMEDWLAWPCSFLEFLIALACAIDDKIMYDPDTPEGPWTWFWEMMANCGLKTCTDEWMMEAGMSGWKKVSEITKTITGRRYEYNGNLGLFPLRRPEMDQRSVEIWYQANAYFIEKYFE